MANTTGFPACAKYLMGSPSKIRPVADLVRSKPYTEAVAILEHLPNKGAKLIRKVVMSAAANALNQNRKLAEDMLYIKELQVNEGPRMRRVWFRARGRADMLVKQMCHISVVVDEIARAEA
ncbi:MAG: 50S ribosomal protein L22 [Spirochaetales bacterium]|nr:MAG: 50S ribosomal protein L22 [Spirochaetales bacterium]